MIRLSGRDQVGDQRFTFPEPYREHACLKDPPIRDAGLPPSVREPSAALVVVRGALVVELLGRRVDDGRTDVVDSP